MSAPDEAPTTDEAVSGDVLLGTGDEDGEGDVDEESHVIPAASSVDGTSNLNQGEDIMMTESQNTEQPKLNGATLEGPSGMCYIPPTFPDDNVDSQ